MVGKSSPRGPAGKGSAGAGLTPSASASEDTSGVAGAHARRIKVEQGTAGAGSDALAGLAGLAALAGAVTEPNGPQHASLAALAAPQHASPAAQHALSMQIASFYALQTELLLFKVRGPALAWCPG